MNLTPCNLCFLIGISQNWQVLPKTSKHSYFRKFNYESIDTKLVVEIGLQVTAYYLAYSMFAPHRSYNRYL